MSFQKEKEKLQEKYASQRKWWKGAPMYGCWKYPSDYYMELIDLVEKYSK